METGRHLVFRLYTYGRIIYCYYWLHATQQRWAAVPPAHQRGWFMSHVFMRCNVEKRKTSGTNQEADHYEAKLWSWTPAWKLPAVKHLCGRVRQWMRAEMWAYCGNRCRESAECWSHKEWPLFSQAPMATNSEQQASDPGLVSKCPTCQLHLKSRLQLQLLKILPVGGGSNPQGQLTAKDDEVCKGRGKRNPLWLQLQQQIYFGRKAGEKCDSADHTRKHTLNARITGRIND